MSKIQDREINAHLPVNKGLDYTRCVPGMPSKGESGKWDQVILPASAVVNGRLVSNRVAIVTSTGQATPATVVEFIKQTSNGNYVFTVQRDKVPAELAAVRKAAADAQKADYKQNGRKATQAAPVQIAIPNTVTPVQVAPVQVADTEPASKSEQAVVNSTGFTLDQVRTMTSAGLSLAVIQGMAQAHQATSSSAPSKGGSVPTGGKGGTLAPKIPTK